MQDRPLISVLMGIYNCASTLKEAVDCIIAQTYANWELIMCDDCSKDDTYAVALELSKRDGRIKVIKNEKNLTLAPTLNRCLEMAQGEFVARMDGDDVCAPERFELELEAFRKNPDCALVSCSMKIFDDDGEKGLINYIEYPQPGDLPKGPPFCHAGCMMKTSVLRELNGYNISKDALRVEDFDLWIRMYEAGYRGVNIPYALYSMRDDLNALKRRKFSHRFIEYKLRKRAIKTFKLSKKNYIYALKPVILAFVPSFIYKRLHRKKVNSK